MNKKEKILVVDDDSEALELMRVMFQHDGYEVMTSGTAEEALEMLERWEADLVISDLRMPGMSGLDFLNELRDWDTSLPIILVSGVSKGKDWDEVASSHATAIISKPFRKETILKTARKALKARHVRSSAA